MAGAGGGEKREAVPLLPRGLPLKSAPKGSGQVQIFAPNISQED